MRVWVGERVTGLLLPLLGFACTAGAQAQTVGIEPAGEFNSNGILPFGCIAWEQCCAAPALHLCRLEVLQTASSYGDLQRVAFDDRSIMETELDIERLGWHAYLPIALRTD